VKNKIIFTLLLTATILSSCSNSNNEQVTKDNNDVQLEVPLDIPSENTDNNQVNTENQAIPDVNPIASIDMSLEPNEIGEIMIVMYHGIGVDEGDWQRTPENFRKDLEYMYQHGYRMISLNDYAKGIITTKAGYTPIILTFDDGRQNNFDLTEKNGEYVINPDCVVGILEEFKEKYQDFNVTASFFLNSSPFGQQEYIDYKLKWLVDNGYDVGNHTYTHDEIAKLNGEDIQSEIGSINNILHKYIPDYAVETLALPHGSNPRDEYAQYVLEGSYEGKRYKNIAVLDVGWRPAYSPFDTCTDFSSLYRVTGSEMNVQNCGIYDYFKQFEEKKREKFVSDGNPDVVTIPKKYEEYINMDIVGDRTLNIFE